MGLSIIQKKLLISIISNIALKQVQNFEKWDYSEFLCDYSKAENIVNDDNEYWPSIHADADPDGGGLEPEASEEGCLW